MSEEVKVWLINDNGLRRSVNIVVGDNADWLEADMVAQKCLRLGNITDFVTFDGWENVETME